MFLWYKQKTAYELRISDWTSDVCSPDLSRLSIAKSIFTPPKGVTLPEVMVGVSHCGYSVSVKSWLAAVLLLSNTPKAVSALASATISTLAGFQYTGLRFTMKDHWMVSCCSLALSAMAPMRYAFICLVSSMSNTISPLTAVTVRSEDNTSELQSL